MDIINYAKYENMNKKAKKKYKKFNKKLKKNNELIEFLMIKDKYCYFSKFNI